MHGPLYAGRAIDADRHGLALAPIVPRKLFLRLDKIAQNGIGYGWPFGDKAGKIWTHRLNAFFDFYGTKRLAMSFTAYA